VEGFTVLSVRGMFGVYVFVGLLLIPPINQAALAPAGRVHARYWYTGTERIARRVHLLVPISPRIIAPILIPVRSPFWDRV